jgi:hypothetical protein
LGVPFVLGPGRILLFLLYGLIRDIGCLLVLLEVFLGA